MEYQECVHCMDDVLTLSSRGWCDGCEGELAECECERGPLGGQHNSWCPLRRSIIPTHPHPVSGR